MGWTALWCVTKGQGLQFPGTNQPLEENNKEDNARVMDIFPLELRGAIPALYAQEGVKDPVVHVKFFTPDSNWTWYATEGSPGGNDFIFFGYVIGLESEWGYFALSDLQSSRGPLGLPIERDLYFHPSPFSQVRN